MFRRGRPRSPRRTPGALAHETVCTRAPGVGPSTGGGHGKCRRACYDTFSGEAASAVTPLSRPPLRPARVPSGDEVLRAEGITVRRGGRVLLGGVDLTVRAGEPPTLVGPNGAGGSPLFSALSGDVKGNPVRGRATRAPCTCTLAGSPKGLPPNRPCAGPSCRRRRWSVPPFPVTELVAMGRTPRAGPSTQEKGDAVVSQAMESTGCPLSRSGASHAVGRGTGADDARPCPGSGHPAAPVGRADGRVGPSAPGTRPGHRGTTHGARWGGYRSAARFGACGSLRPSCGDTVRGRVAAQGAPADVFTTSLLSSVYQHEVEVLPHPRTGVPLVVPLR